MRRINRFGALLFVLISLAILTVFYSTQLQEVKMVHGGEVQKIMQLQRDSPLPTGAVTAEMTPDPFVLTLTAYPTFPPFPKELLTPNPLNAEGTPNTPTPDRFIVNTPTVESPPTALPKGKTVDLAQGTPVPQEQIVIFTVIRANGTYDEYYTPPWLLEKNVTNEYLEQLMSIEPGDRLLGWHSGSRTGGPPSVPAESPEPAISQ